MNVEFYKKNLISLNFQRNAFLALALLLGISQLITSIFLFWKSERTIIVPAVIEKEFWIEGNTVSATYLEQMGYFLGKLVLEKTAQSAPAQRKILLKHVEIAYVEMLNQKLIEEEKMLAKQGASYIFYPFDIQADPHLLKVLMSGERVLLMGGKAVSTVKESYILSFSNVGSRLLLKEIAAKDVQNEKI